MDDDRLRRLKEVVAAHGARPERWPEAERADLEDCSSAHAEAPWLKEARDLDRLLDALPREGMAEGLSERIVAAARGAGQAEPDRVVLLCGQRRGVNALARAGEAAFLAASLAAGLWLGATSSLDGLIGEEPLGLAQLAPGEEAATPLDAVWWMTFTGEEGFL